MGVFKFLEEPTSLDGGDDVATASGVCGRVSTLLAEVSAAPNDAATVSVADSWSSVVSAEVSAAPDNEVVELSIRGCTSTLSADVTALPGVSASLVVLLTSLYLLIP